MHDLRVEFMQEANPPRGQATGSKQVRPALPRLVIAAFALLIAGVFITVRDYRAGSISGRPFAVPTTALSTPTSRCGTACATDPSPAIRAVFAEHLPGSVVVIEDTLAWHGTVASLRLRALRAVYGNVVITVTIQPVSAGFRQAAGVRIVHDGYQIDFTFAGYYPPTASELNSIADDSRLISLQA